MRLRTAFGLWGFYTVLKAGGRICFYTPKSLMFIDGQYLVSSDSDATVASSKQVLINILTKTIPSLNVSLHCDLI